MKLTQKYTGNCIQYRYYVTGQIGIVNENQCTKLRCSLTNNIWIRLILWKKPFYKKTTTFFKNQLSLVILPPSPKNVMFLNMGMGAYALGYTANSPRPIRPISHTFPPKKFNWDKKRSWSIRSHICMHKTKIKQFGLLK